MEPKLKRLHSPDVQNLKEFVPDDLESFCILIQVMVGPANGDGEESFDIEVCTPGWLCKEVKKKKIVPGRHKLIVGRFDYEQIEQYIREFIARCKSDTWKETAERIARLGSWEFEDYSS